MKNTSVVEYLSRTTSIVFDKTGTLTRGEFGVTDVIPLSEVSEEDVLRLAASLESRSEHSLARGVVNGAKDRSIDLLEVESFDSIPGTGVQGEVGGRSLKVTSPGYLERLGIEIEDRRIQEAEEDGKTVVFLLEDEQPIGALALGDSVRAESKEAVSRLKSISLVRPPSRRMNNAWRAIHSGLNQHQASAARCQRWPGLAGSG